MNLSKYFKTLIAFLVVAITFIITAIPAFASDEDATKDVVVMKTQHKWFYWPGWFFFIFTVIAIAGVLFAWYKTVLGPKYRGRKTS